MAAITGLVSKKTVKEIREKLNYIEDLFQETQEIMSNIESKIDSLTIQVEEENAIARSLDEEVETKTEE